MSSAAYTISRGPPSSIRVDEAVKLPRPRGGPSHDIQRSAGGPALLKRPRFCVSAESETLGSSPARRTTWRARRKRRASPISASRWQARIGPTPKIVCSAWQRRSRRAKRASSRSSGAQLLLERVDQTEHEIDVDAAGRRQRERGRPATPLAGQQPLPPAGPALLAEQRVQALRPPGALLRKRLAQPGAVAQLLDLRRSQPRLRQHLLPEQKRTKAGIKPVSLRPPLLPLQRAQLRRIGETNIQPHPLQLARDPTPTSRRLDRYRRQPLPPTHRPIGERLRRSLEPLLDELARFRVERRRLKHVLVDVDHRVKHSLGPPLGFVLERDPTAGRGRPPS